MGQGLVPFELLKKGLPKACVQERNRHFLALCGLVLSVHESRPSRDLSLLPD